MKKNFIQKKFVLKVSDFCFETSSFSSRGLFQFHIAFTAAGMCGIQSMTQFYFSKGVHL